MEHDDEDSFSGSDSSNYGTENLISRGIESFKVLKSIMKFPNFKISKEEGELKDGKSMQNLMINLNF